VSSRGARAVRGVAIAAFAIVVASIAHILGGGSAPGPVAVLLALAFSAPLAMLLASARARLVRTSLSALIAQGALHLCYALGGAPAAGPASVDPHAGHGASVHLDAVLAAPAADHGHALMPFAHLLAAAITVVALALGDDVFDAITRSVLLFARRLTAVPVPVVVVVPFRLEATAVRPSLVGALLHAVRGSRGPPIGAVAS
jgi:hypothetical protein